MKRNLLVIGGGVILSFLLLSVGGWIVLQTSSHGVWIREFTADGRIPTSEETIQKDNDPFDIMARGMRVIQFVLLPIVALFTGTFVGLIARSAVWQTAAISLIPLCLLVLAGHSWNLEGIALSGVYLALCCAASLLLYRWKGKKLAIGTAHV
ncbi:MAG: hypothetical protein ABR568_21890 [Pyrinomonadaceae bacterium]